MPPTLYLPMCSTKDGGYTLVPSSLLERKKYIYK